MTLPYFGLFPLSVSDETSTKLRAIAFQPTTFDHTPAHLGVIIGIMACAIFQMADGLDREHCREVR